MLKTSHKLMFAAARYSNLVYLSNRNRELDAKGKAHSVFNAYDRGKPLHVGVTSWDTVAMCVARTPNEIMLAISEAGEVYSYVGGKEGKEKLPVGTGSQLRDVTSVAGRAYACGMRRQVFRRNGPDEWVDISAPPPGKNDKGVFGFEGIAGISESELFAVGWRGAIWCRRNDEWVQLDSPTTSILTAVACGNDGSAYACGKDSTFVVCRAGELRLVDTSSIADDFWDVHCFNEQVYVASQARVYVYADDALVPVDTGSDRPDTCYKLTSAEGVMWSIGAEDLFAFDGTAWTRVE